MNTPDSALLTSFLNATGPEWRASVRLAAEQLLFDYRTKWERYVPVELNRLAFCRHAKIMRSDRIKREAVILPAKSLFMILVRNDLFGARFRCSVAHEIAHTLFYTIPTANNAGTRIIEHSAKEEQFCFDVARYLLAPEWQLKALGLLNSSDAAEMLHRLVEELMLSRLWAARIILADYSLAKGIAGWWSLTEAGWALEKGQATASPVLNRNERAAFREVAQSRLNGNNVKDGICSVTVNEESGRRRAFVMVTVK